MPRRAATLTQADVARVIRAARAAGAGAVEVRPDGTMLVRIEAPPVAPPAENPQPAVVEDNDDFML
jgi:hypothetical protein